MVHLYGDTDGYSRTQNVAQTYGVGIPTGPGPRPELELEPEKIIHVTTSPGAPRSRSTDLCRCGLLNKAVSTLSLSISLSYRLYELSELKVLRSSVVSADRVLDTRGVLQSIHVASRYS